MSLDPISPLLPEVSNLNLQFAKIFNKLIPLNSLFTKRDDVRERVKNEDYLIITVSSQPSMALVDIPFFEKLMECYEKNGGDKDVNR